LSRDVNANNVATTNPEHAEEVDSSLSNLIKSPLRQSLEMIGMNESVVWQAERGVYTEAQIGKLKAQKLHLTNVLFEAVKKRKAAASEIDQCHLSEDSKQFHSFKPSSFRCNLKSCHSCRPYFQDRMYMPFEDAYEHKADPITEEEAGKKLPVRNAAILRTIGLRQIKEHMPVNNPVQNGLSEESGHANSIALELTTTSESTVSMTTRRSHVDSVKLRLRHNSSKSDQGLPRPSEKLGFVHKLLRLRRHSSAPPSYWNQKFKDEPVEHVFIDRELEQSKDTESMGTEVEVNGGVALTEEAVGTNTPDIITQT
jgi:hypothetical protein